MKSIKHSKEKVKPVFLKKEDIVLTDRQLSDLFFKGNEKNSFKNKYLLICEKLGFRISLKKTTKEFEEEIRIYRDSIVKEKLLLKKKQGKENIVDFLEKDNMNEFGESNEYNQLHSIHKNMNLEQKIAFKKILRKFNSKKFTKLIVSHANKIGIHFYNRKPEVNPNEKIIDLIKNIALNEKYCISNIEDFEIKTKNNVKALEELAVFLFSKYNIDSALKSLIYDPKNISIFIDIANGKKPNTVFKERLPSIEKWLTKKQVNKIVSQKSNKDFFFSCREIMLEGINPKFILALKNHVKMSNFIINEDVFQEFISYLRNNKNLDFFSKDQIMPIYDYIVHEKNIATRDGRRFVIKDYGLDALYEKMNKWHKEIGSYKGVLSWVPIGKDYSIKDERTNANDSVQERIITITELLSEVELRQEGRSMKHCVGSYGRACSNGGTSIFSLKVKHFDSLSFKNIATISVVGRNISQLQGKGNTPIDSFYNKFISEWVLLNGFRWN